MSSYPEFQPRDRAHWRAWLDRHHASATGVMLVFVKKPKRLLSYAEAVEEALCFGWIDSVLRPMDEVRYAQMFTPRKPKSGWSALNKRRVEAMIAQGLMTRAGLARIDAAKLDGSWAKLDHIEQLVLPPAFERALARNRKAGAQFALLTPSQRKIFLYFLSGVKSEEKRAQRIVESIERLAGGAKHPRQPLKAGRRGAPHGRPADFRDERSRPKVDGR